MAPEPGKDRKNSQPDVDDRRPADSQDWASRVDGFIQSLRWLRAPMGLLGMCAFAVGIFQRDSERMAFGAYAVATAAFVWERL